MKAQKAGFDGFGTLLASAGVLGLLRIYLPLLFMAPTIGARVAVVALVLGNFYVILWELARYRNLTKRLLLVAATIAGNYLFVLTAIPFVFIKLFGQ